jgi:hypothetical protein
MGDEHSDGTWGGVFRRPGALGWPESEVEDVDLAGVRAPVLLPCARGYLILTTVMMSKR